MDHPSPPTSLLGPSGKPFQPEADLTGRTLGDYLLLRRLGQGGMGQVYLAEQLSLKRKVALKLLRSELAANSTALQRFKAEAEAVARATHANIVQVYNIDQQDGVHFMALEYVEGRNLREYLARKGPPDVLLAVSIMRQVAAALQRASELGIIHRDVKPENILLTRKGEVKVADFGLSRVLSGDQPNLNLTQTGVTMGTPLYMSPEQVEGKTVDCRTDIYSFGVTAYSMMAGHPPFDGASSFEVALQHVQKQPQPLASIRPDLPETLCAIIHKMMAKNPDQRYQTGRELLKDLSRLRENLSGITGTITANSMGVELVAATPASSGLVAPQPPLPPAIPVALPRPFFRRLPVLVGFSLLVAVGLGVTFGWLRQRITARSAVAVTPADVATVDALFSTQQREQALAQAAEQYLNPSADFQNATAGLLVCLDLGLFYLDHDRLDAADKLFARLEGLKQAKYYRILGQLGRAIVLALRSQAPESVKVFHQVFTNPALKFPEPGGAASKKPRERVDPEMQIFSHSRLRFWLAEAMVYNAKNGFPDRDWLPPALRPGLRP